MAIQDQGILDGWKGLSQLVDQRFKEGWIYRGVPDYDPKKGLRPRIGRERVRINKDGMGLPYDAQEERRLLRQFQREARALFEWVPKSDLEWMILGQHHLLPTRLLDWSESLLVAAYFAVADAERDPKTYAAIYGVKPPEEIESDDPFSNNLSCEPKLVRPPHINPRITAQQGVLTLHPKPAQDWDTDGIYLWRIKTTQCFTLKGKLNFCGIHAASLFPDSADWHTKHLHWLHKVGRLS